MSESPIFKFMKRAGEEIKIPLVTLFGRAWKQILIVALSTLFTNVMGFIGLIFMLRYATTTLGFTRSTILTFTIIANLIEIPATLYFADLSDRVGRRTIYLWALAFAIVWGAVFFPLVNTAIPAVVFAAILVARLCIAAIFGPQAALFSELFDTNIRYSGISVGYSISSIIGAQTPAIAALLVAATGGTSDPVGIYCGRRRDLVRHCVVPLGDLQSGPAGQAGLTSRAGPAHDREALREFAWTTEAGGWPSTCCLNPTGSVRTC